MIRYSVDGVSAESAFEASQIEKVHAIRYSVDLVSAEGFEASQTEEVHMIRYGISEVRDSFPL